MCGGSGGSGSGGRSGGIGFKTPNEYVMTSANDNGKYNPLKPSNRKMAAIEVDMADGKLALTGRNTYGNKDAIKALGARWNSVDKQWELPATKTNIDKVMSLGKKFNRVYIADDVIPFYK
jgi:hypothetical protein